MGDPTLYWVLVMVWLGVVLIVAGVVTWLHLRLPAPPVPKLARSEWFAYRVLLTTRKRRWLFGLTLVGILCGGVVQAIVGTRHLGWGQTALVVGRGLAIAVAIVFVVQILVSSPDDPYIVRQPLDPAFDDLAPDVTRVVLRLLLLKLIAVRLLIAVALLLCGVWLRFGLSLELFVVWLGILTVLYVLMCIAEIGTRRLWQETVMMDDDDGEDGDESA